MSKSFFMGSPNFKNRRGPVSGFFTGWGIISAKWFQLTLSNIKWTNFDFRVWFDLLTRETLNHNLMSVRPDRRKSIPKTETLIIQKSDFWRYFSSWILAPFSLRTVCCYYFLVLVRGSLLRPWASGPCIESDGDFYQTFTCSVDTVNIWPDMFENSKSGYLSG